jgi:hypothetical protein
MKIKKMLFIVAMLIFTLNITAFAEDRRPLGENETRPRLSAINEDYLPIKNTWYHRQYDGAWIYLDNEGLALQNTWFHDPADGKWYYFDEYCYMLHDATTPDGYTVGPDGAWIREGQVVIEVAPNN